MSVVDEDPVPGTARLVLTQARLAGHREPTSIVVVDGVITRIGEAAAGDAADADVLDLAGRTVVPGLWDAHVHAEQWAVARRRLDLRDVGSARAAADRVAAAADGGDAPLVGYGYRDGLWADAPHKDLLEAAAPGRIVVLQSNDLHTVWLSPAALDRIGAAQHPTGVLQERDCYRAMQQLQEFDTDTIDAWVADAMSAAAARGVTGIVDFEFGDAVTSWTRRAAGGPPAVRVNGTVYPDHLDAAIGRGLPSGALVPGTGGLVEVGPLKLFVDGSLNSRTALCHKPYPDLAGTAHAHGRLETPPEELRRLMQRAADHGIASAVHAIGDRANQLALDAFQAVGCPGRIEHAQLVARADVERFAQLGLVVGVQPAHLLDDRDVAERHWPGRTDRTFPLADLLAAGVQLEFGSDAPVAPLDPWLAIAAAVTRSAEGDEPWHPEQRIGIADALAASSRGRRHLRPGDPADLVVLDRDPVELDAASLADPGVVATMCAGRWTYRAAVTRSSHRRGTR